jgi:hypothetical protein
LVMLPLSWEVQFYICTPWKFDVRNLEYSNLCLQYEGEDIATWHAPSRQRSIQMESGRNFVQYGGTFGVLEEIAVKCGFKVASMMKKSYSYFLIFV